MGIPEPELKLNEKLRRVSIDNLKKEIGSVDEPLVLTSGGKPIGIVYPYDKKLDVKIKKVIKTYAPGDVGYEDYKAQLIAKGMEDLMNGGILVKPSDIISAEALEEVKKRTKMIGADLLMQGAKFWAMRHKEQLCVKCGHQMIPAQGMEDDVVIPLVGKDVDGSAVALNAGSN